MTLRIAGRVVASCANAGAQWWNAFASLYLDGHDRALLLCVRDADPGSVQHRTTM